MYENTLAIETPGEQRKKTGNHGKTHTDISINDTEETNGKDLENLKPEVTDGSWDLSETLLAEKDRDEYVFKIKILPEGGLSGILQKIFDDQNSILSRHGVRGIHITQMFHRRDHESVYSSQYRYR